MKRSRTVKPLNDSAIERTKKKRKDLISETKDKILNLKRAAENVGAQCIICGKEIKKNQPLRELPKDKNCQEVRVYHVRTCGPGSDNWKTFKANDQKTPILKGQLSFTWIKRKG